ncbi:MAG: caspase family protein, partial [Saprospiraceae bacterium]|nr:caspase family protein [Saprospiraceae bacterium]
MEILPYNFDPQRTLSPMERYKVEFYYQRFVVERYREYGDGHFLLACYAALPVLMTPDLLYKLWLNFSDYNDGSRPQRINRLAVADLLLSPMFSEIGQETFEMSNPLRNALLAWWQEEKRSSKWVRLPDLEEVAWFLLDYLKTYSTRNSAADQAFREAQEWMALSYVEPQSAYRQLVKALADASSKAKANPDDQSFLAEKLRLMETIGRMEQRYKLELKEKTAQVPTGFNMLAGYAGAMKNQLAGMDATNLLEGMDLKGMQHVLSDTASETAISFPVPEKMLGDLKTDEEDREASKLYALIIGINDYQYFSQKLSGCVKDAETLATAIRAVDAAGLEVLLDGKATKSNVEEKIRELAAQAKPNDRLFIAFFGHNMAVSTDDEQSTLLMADSSEQNTKVGIR